jgi:hypothetical protein
LSDRCYRVNFHHVISTPHAMKITEAEPARAINFC